MEGESIGGESYAGERSQQIKVESQIFECIKLDFEESCFGETESTWSEPNSTGNILERIIRDPSRKRPPALGKWTHQRIYKNLKAEKELNEHQYNASKKSTPLDQMCCLRVTSDPHSYRQPAIIGTIGPSCTTSSEILELLETGMNIARINMSHVNQCNQTEYIQNIIEASNRYCALKDYGIPIGIMMDLKGPEIRTGMLDPARFKNPKKVDVILREEETVTLTTDKIFQNRCTENFIFVDYEPLTIQLKPGMTLYISHGGIKLRVISTENTSAECKIEKGGILKSYQYVNIPMLPLCIPTISNYDIQCLDLALDNNVDIVAVSRTQNADTIDCVKKILEEKNKDNGILVLAKISTYQGLRNIDKILKVADGVILQRNDLVLEIPPSKVFIAQKEIIGKCNKIGKSVICTAQLSVRSGFAPCRTELSDIGGCIVDGADCILISEETTVGTNGPASISQLCEMCREAEAATMQIPYFSSAVDAQNPSLEPIHAITIAAVQIANKIEAAAILAITTSGRTAQFLSWYRPRCPVIAITRCGKTSRQLLLWRSVLPLHYTGLVCGDYYPDVTARFEYGINYGRDVGIIQSGDPLVLVSGYRKQSGFTNCLRVVFASTEERNFVSNLDQYYGASDK